MAATVADRGAMRAALANSLVAVMKRYFGRGPTAAKAWILDDYVFVALEDGLTRSEETLLADGKDALIREYRMSFQDTIRDEMMETVEQIVGRRVLTYHSQVVFEPPRTFEVFVLEPEVSS